VRTFIERVPADRREAIGDLERWKAMRREGWELHVLHSPRERELIAFGYLEPDVQLCLRT
jgi:hypothetical protein